MPYLLLIAFPIMMGASLFMIRKQTQLTLGLACVIALAQIVLVTQLPIDTPSRLLGLTLTLDPLGRLFLITFVAISALAFVIAWMLPHGEHFAPITLVMLGLISSIIVFLQEPFVVALLLVSVGLVAVLAIIDLPTGSRQLVERTALAAALKYLVMMTLAGVMMYMGFVLVSIYTPGEFPGRISPAHLVLGLLAIGFGLRLAILPFHSWLPDLARETFPMVSVLVIGVINATSLLFLVSALQFFPVIVLENARGLTVLMWIGAITAVYGALLALAQPEMRRMIGALLVSNSGMIIFGIASTSIKGLTGALFESFNQLIVLALLFVAIALLERPDGRPTNVVRRDLLWRWPIAGAGLIGGVMALLGVPPFGGFASKLLLYEAAAQLDGRYLALFLAATSLGLVALVRLAQNRLLGPPEEQPVDEQPVLLGTTELDRPAERRLDPEPRGLAIVTLVLLGACLVVGVFPQPIIATIAEVVQGLTFVRA
ncbi:MAG: hypothetical protein KGS47_07890 [Chloroflexi bacterium]|nr:hypothetical protein [Chloroflexota bacterium]